MGLAEVQTGFELWITEAEAAEGREAQIPTIALAGIYAALIDKERPRTSYAWRQTVLESRQTCEVLLQVLPDMQRHYFDDDYEIPLTRVAPSTRERSDQQFRAAHASVMDGVPKDVSTIRENEYFLANTLGFAIHDYAIALCPLRLTTEGKRVVRDFFPKSAELIETKA